MPPHQERRVPPFGNPRIKALSAAPRGLSRPHTSFIGPVRQGIHHTPFTTTPNPQKGFGPSEEPSEHPDNTSSHKMITKRSTEPHDNNHAARRKITADHHHPTAAGPARVHYPVLKQPPHNQPPQTPRRKPGQPAGTQTPPTRTPVLGSRSGNPTARPIPPRTDRNHTSTPHNQPQGQPPGRRARTTTKPVADFTRISVERR